MRRHTDYEDMLAAYDGLAPAERRELDAHLTECQVCAAELAAYRQMDGEIRSARALKASAGLRVRFNEAISSAFPPPATEMARPAVREPIIRNAKRPRQPWTWSRALVPVGFLLLFAVVVALSLPHNGANESEVLQPQVAAPPQQAAIVNLTFTCEDISGYVRYEDWYKLLADFEAENPDVTVEFTPAVIAATNGQSYEDAMADAAKRIDVFCAMPDPSDLQASSVTNLAPYIANDPAFNPDDFYPNLLRAWEDGAVLSVPMYFRPLLINYNPETFAKAGVSHPKPDWTWDEFLATATALGKVDGDKVEQWGYYEVGAALFTSRLQSAWSADFQTPPDYATMADILGWYEKLYAQARAADVPPALGWIAGQQHTDRSLEMLMAAGKVAMWDASWQDAAREPRYLAFPDASRGAYVGRLNELAMSGQTRYPDQAWRLINYISRHLPDAEVPARRSQAEQASFWQELDADSAAAYRYMLAQPIRPYVKLPGEYMRYQDAAIAVAKGEKTVAQALADLDAQVTLRGGPTERAAAGAVDAAKSAQAATPAPVEATTLEFHCEPFLAYDGLYQVIAAFEAENPGVKVYYLPVSATGNDEASYQAGMADAAAKSDVFCAMPGLTELQRGVVIDLAPYIAADASFRPEDFYGGALRPLAENGAMLSVPTYIVPFFISYDPQAFDAAGLPYPQPGWTWDDFLATAVQLTQREGDKVGRWGFYELGGAVFTGRLHAGWSMDAQTPPDYAEMERILRWYETMYVRERAAAVPPALSLKGNEAISGAPFRQMVRAGKVAMWEDGGADYTRADGKPQVAAYPKPNQGAFYGRTGELVMSGETQRPDLAWRWISYLSQHLPDEKIPARRSLAENATFWNRLDESSKAAYRYTLDHIAPVNVRFPDEYQHYLDAVIAVAKGEKTVEQALSDLHAQVKLRGGP